MRMDTIAAVLNASLKVLAGRVLSFLALGMTFGLYCWSMFRGQWISFVIASVFGVTIFLPVLLKQVGASNDADQT